MGACDMQHIGEEERKDELTCGLAFGLAGETFIWLDHARDPQIPPACFQFDPTRIHELHTCFFLLAYCPEKYITFSFPFPCFSFPFFWVWLPAFSVAHL